MNTMNKTVVAAAQFLWNKAPAIIILILLMILWNSLKEASYPFIEFLYAAIVGVATIVFAPLIRLVVFPEAAEYGESGALRTDLEDLPSAPLRYLHYRMATVISYSVAAISIAFLLRA